MLENIQMRYRRIENDIKDKCCYSNKENLNYKCHMFKANKMCIALHHDVMLYLFNFFTQNTLKCNAHNT